MNKRICVLYTETNGLHKTNDDITKKNLFCFARLVVLNYEIGIIEDGYYTQEKLIRQIIKPRCMIIHEETIQYHGITQEIAEQEGMDPEQALIIFKNDIKNVDIIISHNVKFHFNTIIAESLKYNLPIDFNEKIIIDTVSFYHDYGYIKLKDLAQKLKIKEISKNNIELIRTVFFKLYSKFKNIKK